jgi:hypothetical protein
MRFATFRLEKGECLKRNDCLRLIKGGKDVVVYFQEAIRSDPPAIGKILCKECMDITKKELKGTDIQLIIVGEEENDKL